MPSGSLAYVLDHDFPLPEKGKAAPYGEEYVNVGISSDTAVFAVNSVRNWWYYMGADRFPNASCLYITADGGEAGAGSGKPGSRIRLMIPIEVSHFPSGTSKMEQNRTQDVQPDQ